jgi:hypothetical protein
MILQWVAGGPLTQGQADAWNERCRMALAERMRREAFLRIMDTAQREAAERALDRIDAIWDRCVEEEWAPNSR